MTVKGMENNPQVSKQAAGLSMEPGNQRTMPRPYILAHNDKWFIFLGCTLVALCTTKAEALELQREWIRKSQAVNTIDEIYVMPTLPDRPTALLENGNN